MSLSLRLFGETTHKVFLSSSSSSVSTRTRSPPFSSLLSSSSSTAFFSHHRHLLSKEVETRRSNISFSSCTFHSLSSSTSFDVSLFIEDRKMRRMFSSSQGKWSDSVRQKMDELKQKSKKSRDSLDAIKRVFFFFFFFLFLFFFFFFFFLYPLLLLLLGISSSNFLNKKYP